MAVGTVSGVDPADNWQLIATNTPSAASVSSFTSLSGYKKFWLVYKNVTTSISSQLALRFNSDSTSGNYGGDSFWASTYVESWVQDARIVAVSGSSFYGGSVIIDNSLPAIHTITVNPSYYNTVGGGVWMPTTATDITQIDFRTTAGGTLSGTIYLYGIAA